MDTSIKNVYDGLAILLVFITLLTSKYKEEAEKIINEKKDISKKKYELINKIQYITRFLKFKWIALLVVNIALIWIMSPIQYKIILEIIKDKKVYAYDFNINQSIYSLIYFIEIYFIICYCYITIKVINKKKTYKENLSKLLNNTELNSDKYFDIFSDKVKLKVLEIIYKISLYLVVFMSQSEFLYSENIKYYNIFYILTIDFGYLYYSIKKESKKEMITNLLCDISVPIIGGLIIIFMFDKSYFSDIKQYVYIGIVVAFVILKNEKQVYIIKGVTRELTSYQFLRQKIGKNAIITESMILIVPFLLAIIGASVMELVVCLSVIEFIVVPLIAKASLKK